MVRTLVTLEDMDKRWLDRYSERHKQSSAETMRLAIKEFQKKSGEENYRQALSQTQGLLKNKTSKTLSLKNDSVRFVRKLRGEWR